jgi:hypothetical protein
MLSEKETFIGRPDCADGSGLFIQYHNNGAIKSFKIDQKKAS